MGAAADVKHLDEGDIVFQSSKNKKKNIKCSNCWLMNYRVVRRAADIENFGN